ncbi:hypothetical protein Ancab_007156 [Ancistrocladus abbreviatus]
MRTLEEPKHGFWSSLARKAEAILEDDIWAQKTEAFGAAGRHEPDKAIGDQYCDAIQSPEGHKKMESVMLQKGFGAIASTLSYISGTIGNALEIAKALEAISMAWQ